MVLEGHWLVFPCTHLADTALFRHCDLREHFCSTVHHPHRGFTLAAQLRQSVKLEHCSMGTWTTYEEEGEGSHEHLTCSLTY